MNNDDVIAMADQRWLTSGRKHNDDRMLYLYVYSGGNMWALVRMFMPLQSYLMEKHGCYCGRKHFFCFAGFHDWNLFCASNKNF